MWESLENEDEKIIGTDSSDRDSKENDLRSNDEKLADLRKEKENLENLTDELEAQDKIINNNIDELVAAASEAQDEEMNKMTADLQERMSDLKILTFKKLTEIADDIDDEIKFLKSHN